MRDEQPKYQEQGVRTFGVNPAPVARHAQYAAKFRFTFPLLADTARDVSTAYHVLRRGRRWPLRTVYLIGTDARVRFAQRGVPDADQILASLG